MQKQTVMKTTLDEEVTISLHEDNSVVITHSVVKHRRKHEFKKYKDGEKFFKQIVGALYLDGYS